MQYRASSCKWEGVRDSMKEKLNSGDKNVRQSGIWKPKGKIEKRRIHKKVRKMKDVFRSVVNRVGTFFEWE
jgi:hypothetical protein